MAKNIIITKREEESLWGFRYCEVKGTKWFNRCVFPEDGRLEKGDVFNVYRREYETDSKGNITRWICDSKFGCEYDGRSIVSSLEAFDKELDEYYTTGAGRYSPRKPLA